MNEVSFGTNGWRATLDTFTDSRVCVVGQAITDYLADEGSTAPVLVGYDTRKTSPGFAESFVEVVAGNDFDVPLPKRDCPTPLITYIIADRGLSEALVVTASHNPSECNGVKFIPSDGAPALPDVTDTAAEQLTGSDPLPEPEHDTIEHIDMISPYTDHAMDLIGDDLSDLTVVYDAMRSSGRGVISALLEAAGARVARLRCERDAGFGGISPGPSAEGLGGPAGATTGHDADLGVASDNDADRIGVATPDHGILNENLFFAVVYGYPLESDSGPTIQTVSTTFLINRIAEAHGEEVLETAVGFKWVTNDMRGHDALMGGEKSGGFSIRGHVREKGGILVGLLATVAIAEENFDTRLSRTEAGCGNIVADRIGVAYPDAEKAHAIDDLEDVLPEAVAGRDIARVITLNGFKLLLDNGS